MATSPDRVRAGLTVVTGAATATAREVASRGETPSEIRAALFEATPLIVTEYIDGSAALALDWYDELREDAAPRRRYTPAPLTIVREDEITKSVAWATSSLYDLEQNPSRMTPELLVDATTQSLALLEPVIQKDVASGYWDTIVSNSNRDPSAVGWQRFARAGACKFCLMLAGRGAVYKQRTANFAAHTSCHCVCGPSFEPSAPEASVVQYVASRRVRTPEENAQVRAYLNENFPDAPG